MYEQALEYLRQHPEAALQAQEQMRRMGSPAMAQAASRQMQDPQYRLQSHRLNRQTPPPPPSPNMRTGGLSLMRVSVHVCVCFSGGLGLGLDLCGQAR